MPCPFLLNYNVMLKCFQGGTSIMLPYASVNTQMCMGVIKPILFEGSSKQKDTAFSKRNTCKCLCMLGDEEIHSADENRGPALR